MPRARLPSRDTRALRRLGRPPPSSPSRLVAWAGQRRRSRVVGPRLAEGAARRSRQHRRRV